MKHKGHNYIATRLDKIEQLVEKLENKLEEIDKRIDNFHKKRVASNEYEEYFGIGGKRDVIDTGSLRKDSRAAS